MTQLINSLTRHQVNVSRFAEGQARKALPILRELAKDLQMRIAAGGGTELSRARMIRLEAEISEVVSSKLNQYQMSLQLEEFAEHEIKYNQRVLAGYAQADLAGLQAGTAAAIVTKSEALLTNGKTQKCMSIDALFKELGEATAKETKRIMQAGVVEGKTTEQIARDVYRAVGTRTRAQARATTATAINHISSESRTQLYAANDDVLEGERFLATLDSHTTVLCGSLDQTVYELGKAPRPPLHYNCRSLIVPVVKAKFRKDVMGERASADGLVSNQTTYSGWLKGQTKEFQDDVLGAKRAELFRSGKLPLDKFVADNGRLLTLQELEQKFNIETQ